MSVNADRAGTPPLYRASVPVFLTVLDRLGGSLARASAVLGPRIDEALAQRPGPRMLPAGRQVATAVHIAELRRPLVTTVDQIGNEAAALSRASESLRA